MEQKNLYIPGDLVMTNGVPLGTAKGVVYRVTATNLNKTLRLKDGTVLKGVVCLNNIECAEFGDKGYLMCECCAWVKDIVPLELSSEILEKNGWKKTDATWIYKREGSVTIFRLLDDKSYAAYIGNIRLLEFQFVHQLQHLLFGLGLDSNIKL